MAHRHSLVLAVAAGSALACLSCSGSGPVLNPVQGKVLYKDQPLRGVLVTFHPTGPTDVHTLRPTGLTREDGTFSLTTGQSEGAPAGTYVITFLCPEEVGPKGKKALSTAPPDTQDRFQGAYANHATSPFTAEVKKGPNQLEPFRLK